MRLATVDRHGRQHFMSQDANECREFLRERGLECDTPAGWHGGGMVGICDYAGSGWTHAACWRI